MGTYRVTFVSAIDVPSVCVIVAASPADAAAQVYPNADLGQEVRVEVNHREVRLDPSTPSTPHADHETHSSRPSP